MCIRDSTIAAGADMFLFARNLEEDYSFMLNGVKKGVITLERLSLIHIFRFPALPVPSYLSSCLFRWLWLWLPTCLLYTSNGKISHKQALEKAYGEYEIFNRTQPIESDFDKAVKKMIETNEEK